MRCPGCSEDMVQEDHHGVQLDLCERCPAVWFDWGELEDYHANGGGTSIAGLPKPTATFQPTGETEGVCCPGCRRDLLRTGQIGRTKVLRCTSCGGLFVPLVSREGGLLSTAFRTLQEIISALV